MSAGKGRLRLCFGSPVDTVHQTRVAEVLAPIAQYNQWGYRGGRLLL